MTASNRDAQIDRRTVLRTATASVGGLAVLGQSGRARAATCPRSREYWARTDWCRDNGVRESDVLLLDGLRCSTPGESTVELRQTGVRRTVREWQSFLDEETTDPVETTAQTLLVTVLNFQSLGDCVDEPVDLEAYGLGETTPRALKRRTEQWLETTPFGVDTNRGRSWTSGGFDVRPYQRALAAFNDGALDTACPTCKPETDSETETDGEPARVADRAPRGGRAEAWWYQLTDLIYPGKVPRFLR